MVKRDGYRCAPPILRGSLFERQWTGLLICLDRQITACCVQPPSQKYFCFSEMQIKLYDSPSHPTEGRIVIVTDSGRDVVEAAVPLTNGTCFGRRRRVVLPVSN